MTDARQAASGRGEQCPDFEVLSCFADGELTGDDAECVTGHVAGCPRCDHLTARLREGFDGDEARADGGTGGSGCVGEERLVLYASGGLIGDARAVIDAHVAGCDPCVASIVQIHRRLSVLADVAAPIPAGVARRAQAVLPGALAELEPAAAPVHRLQPTLARDAGPGLIDRLRTWLQVPVLAPLAMAAIALIMVGIGFRPTTEPAGIERSRALPPASVRLRVNAGDTTLYSRPSGKSAAVATVARGATVEVAGEERDWYEVRLDDGRSGWIAREAFE
jgi:hypothetical protein